MSGPLMEALHTSRRENWQQTGNKEYEEDITSIDSYKAGTLQ
jgi:hypothetical protein